MSHYLWVLAVWAAQSILAYAMACGWWDWAAEHEWPFILNKKRALYDTVLNGVLAALPFSLISSFFISEFGCKGLRLYVRPSSTHGGPVR